MKVLFIGNSHTFFNDMPELFARFVERTTGEKPGVVMLAYPGRDMQWHRKEYFAMRFNMMHGGYDYCVIQQAAHPYPPIEETLRDGAAIIDLCHRCGVKPVVFMTWAEKRFPENQQKMIDACERLSADNHALLAPIGRLWQTVQRERPDVELYHTDGEHAGPYGDFLIAAALCRAIAGGVSPSVSGMGLNFIGAPAEGKPFSIEEDIGRLEIALDAEKTDYILGVVNG